MTRWLLLSAALISLPVLTDAAVDYSFRHEHPDQGIGYSKQQVESLDRLAARLSEPKKRHVRLSGFEEQAAVRYLWGDGR